MAGTAEDVIRAAESQLGNTNGAKYFAYFGAPDYGPWCVAFVRWCMAVAGVEFPWSTWYAWDYSDAPNPISPRNLKPGDALSFDWDDDGGGDHVGIVKSVHDWGCVTIEGNTSGGVCAERQRVWGAIICGIRPRYASGLKVDVDGWGGYETISHWQELMGTYVDGVLSDQRRANDHWRSHIVAVDHGSGEDGGSSLVRAAQRLLSSKGYDVGPRTSDGGFDGDWGWWFSGAVQQYLRDLGYYTGRIDHDFASHSTECLQMSINDGKWE